MAETSPNLWVTHHSNRTGGKFLETSCSQRGLKPADSSCLGHDLSPAAVELMLISEGWRWTPSVRGKWILHMLQEECHGADGLECPPPPGVLEFGHLWNLVSPGEASSVRKEWTKNNESVLACFTPESLWICYVTLSYVHISAQSWILYLKQIIWDLSSWRHLK